MQLDANTTFPRYIISLRSPSVVSAYTQHFVGADGLQRAVEVVKRDRDKLEVAGWDSVDIIEYDGTHSQVVKSFIIHKSPLNALMAAVKSFFPETQLKAVAQLAKGEEANYFIETLTKLRQTFETMPKTYEQDGKGKQAIAYLHYFSSGADWYITERDKEPGQHQAFGLVSMPPEYPELGYISIAELITSPRIEIDFHFTPTTLETIMSGMETRVRIGYTSGDDAYQQALRNARERADMYVPGSFVLKDLHIKYWVTMTDKVMSGRISGGKIAKLVLECDNYHEAEVVAQNAHKRTDMKYINILNHKPYYDPRKYSVEYHNKQDYSKWYRENPGW